MLCNACEKIFDSSVKSPHGSFNNQFAHHNAAYEIEIASLAGCFICSTVWDRLTDEEKDLVRSERAKKLRTKTLSIEAKRMSEVIWRRVVWGASRLVLNSQFKQTALSNDFSFYSWTADYDRGVVVFSLGTRVWKEIAFMLVPDLGEHYSQSFQQYHLANGCWLQTLCSRIKSD